MNVISAKRFTDLLLSVLGVVFLLPLISIIAILIYVVNGSPILFKQKRVGLLRREFIIYKFRTMEIRKNPSSTYNSAVYVKSVTPFGRYLRRWKFDEIPQLWNVIKGDMSIVGPRPELPYWLEKHPELWGDVFAVLPGITDPASILFRNEETILNQSANPEAFYELMILPTKLKMNMEYIRNISITQDIMIILSTLRAILLR